VYWQSLPQCRFAWLAVFAPCGLLLPLFFPLSLIPFFVCPHLRCGTAIPRQLFIYFSISFSDLFHFPSPPPSGGGFRASSPIYGFFLFPGAFGPFSVKRLV
jgi:hypothetical protein